MPIKRTAYKELRKSGPRRIVNKATRSELKTLAKKFEAFVAEKKRDEALKLVNTLVSKIDRAASKGVIHKNNAARHISRLMRKLSSLGKV